MRSGRILMFKALKVEKLMSGNHLRHAVDCGYSSNLSGDGTVGPVMMILEAVLAPKGVFMSICTYFK